jgi:multidrug efflux system membrane fusion protein
MRIRSAATSLLFLALAACDQAPPPSAAVEIKPVRVAPVRLEESEQTVRYSAVIRPRIEADLGFRVGGKLAERLVEVGSRVEAGTVLARLDDSDLLLQVRAAEAQLASVKADETNAQDEHDRAARLSRDGWSSRQELDRRVTALERARAKRREVEANLAVLRNAAQYTSLHADRAGIVTAVLVEPGQVLAQGQPAFRLARDGELEAMADIPESQARGLGERALSVELWSLPGVVLPGSLRELSPSADPVTRTYRARITLDQPPAAVQIGMTATVSARSPAAAQVARVPMTAVTQADGKPAVWIVESDQVALRPVGLGGFVGDWAVIETGLSGSERVVTAGVHKLHAGQRVRIWTEPAQ